MSGAPKGGATIHSFFSSKPAAPKPASVPASVPAEKKIVDDVKPTKTVAKAAAKSPAKSPSTQKTAPKVPKKRLAVDSDESDFEGDSKSKSKATTSKSASVANSPPTRPPAKKARKVIVEEDDEPVAVTRTPIKTYASVAATKIQTPSPLVPKSPLPPPKPKVVSVPVTVKPVASSSDYFSKSSAAEKPVVTSKYFSEPSAPVSSVSADFDDDDVQIIGTSQTKAPAKPPAPANAPAPAAVANNASSAAQTALVAELCDRDVEKSIAQIAASETNCKGVDEAMAWLESQDYFTSGKLKNYKKASAPAPVKVVPSIPVKGTGIKIVPAADDDLIPSSVPTKVAPTSTLKPVPTPVQSATDKPSDVPTSSPAIKRKWIPNQSDKTPPMAGQKPLPEGADLCLTGLTFVVTGVLDSLDRDQAHDLISRFGGRHTSAVSGKTSYLLCGMEPGESKVSEAHAKNVPIVDEDGLFDLIRTLPEGGKAPAEKTTKSKEKKSREIPAATTVKSDPSASASPAVSISAPVVENKPTPSPAVASSPATSLPSVKSTSSPVAAANPFSAPRANPFGAFGGGGNFSASAAKAGAFSATAAAASPFSRPNAIISSTPFSSQSSTNSAVTTPVASSLPANDASTSTLLWVDKYKPTRVDQLVGMGGIAQKLTEWLRGWEDHWLDSNRQADSDDDAPATKKPRTAAAALTGLRENSKAVLLSGPPGVGKTSCANLVAQQLGYDVIALNASDSRSKKVIKEQFGHLVQNRSMSQFFTGSKQKAVSKRTMLIMDEVDGMGGGDRGGISELILMIRRAQMPIVCIANDRGKQALKSLINYCYDLRVNKPHDQSVAKRLATIAQNEGMHIEPNALEGISAMTHGDLRQAINLLYMWRRKNGNMKQTDLKGLRDSSMKDMDKGVWNIAPVFFQRPKPSDNKWTDERIEAFFNDTMFMPGYVQDTYVTSRGPVNGSKQDTIKHLFALAEAADSMSEATLVHRRVYSSQDYTLSQFHGFMACIRPGMSVAGTVSGNQFGFPSYMGKSSTQRKNKRLVSELTTHLGSNITGGSRAVAMDYFPMLRDRFSKPLMQKNMTKEQIASTCTAVVEEMNAYGICKEDVQETLWTLNSYGKFDEKEIASNVKSAFTRTCTKIGKTFSTDALVKAVSSSEDAGDVADDDGLAPDEDDEEEEQEEADDDDDLSKSKTIKQKEAKSFAAAAGVLKKR